MKLLPNEEKLITSNNDKVNLTNHRIQMRDSVWGKSYTISIFLEDISSIEIKYKSILWLLILGSLCLLSEVYMLNNGGGNEWLLILGIGFIAAWWFSRRHVISISSDGGSSLSFIVEDMGDEKINDFVYNVSLAKQARVNQLAKI